MKRNTLLHVSMYQRPIVYLSLIPLFVFSVIVSVFIILLQNQLIAQVKATNLEGSIILVVQWSNLALTCVWGYFVLAYGWIQYSSSRIVGAFERIIRDLDDVAEGKRTEPITARDNDYMANAFLRRVNALIEKIAQPQAA